MATLLLALASTTLAQELEIPRRHDRPPGPPLSAEEAVAKMTVPEGFSVEIVAAEPDVVNPIGMFIDEKGRYWITESLEYPRREPGPGRDRVKVLEDTDGDGAVDKTTVFADGLNIPSGIAVGYGGVWVANAPDILFMQDTDGDLKADKIETVVTGFGRTDTHELPNSFTWGPDGWLYGLNGVFNHSHVKYGETNPNFDADHAGWQFTCAMWRIHPRTREFQVFAEGTSNPWGIAINDEGEFFISACVIDHLWHIVETGYYIRQGGPYPAHTWPIESIVEHKHQKAAYCGITWFDSDAYPEEYRRTLYMGNIHGGCINADVLQRNGSTYNGKPHPGFPPKPGAWDNDEYDLIRKTGDPDNPRLADFLTANDAWFMPVVQKTGPDGCLYILDWYDRYHCYQDANADPEGIERAKGRLYRVRYKDNPHAQPFDLNEKSDEELITLLGDPNIYYRETAQRLLSERANDAGVLGQLEALVVDESVDVTHRTHALWARISAQGAPRTVDADRKFAKTLWEMNDPRFQRWGIRMARSSTAPAFTGIQHELLDFATSDDPVLKLEAAIGADCEVCNDTLRILLSACATCGDDPLIPHIVWQNLEPLLEDHSAEFLEIVSEYDLKETPNLAKLMPRITERLLDRRDEE
ncbi:MAG: hypothetical protein DWQ34_03595 [Planctomycetota bacterium]|nr:MAG: hypothetical protein DWQ34_03595 [Planctomycetota bacterium]REK24762.1 MAG: hypothetical protein DWQ41_13365 [Planctomycetota bacterium]REK30004.1 MAG: hypothetical protein DWQ45_22050 [Planctomycetota bacterium]